MPDALHAGAQRAPAEPEAADARVGKEFDIVTVSIDPSETPALAAPRRRLTSSATAARGPRGWHFLTGDEPSIPRLAEAVGFRYAYDPKTDQYAHPAGIVIATPRGGSPATIYGIELPGPRPPVGLIEASAGKIGSPIDKIAAVLLPLRSQDGQVQLRHHERDPSSSASRPLAAWGRSCS